ncbi:LLM class flavin-dependent oxidoreductase [Nocardia sp. BMG51109]|uniref:LLM class flavin-dependent oxidoreductase n=1 Tax=Nocardia sp. BMG51109 TaxID=1056816 RepID=UPI0004673E58|nr:LLM class flavin-dependent oxidoreductase [Nocardia sp. BMG51109]
MNASRPIEFRVFSTCPYWTPDESDYLKRIHRIARWCENAGHEGALVYTDNSTADPWLVASEMLRATERLVPLIAVQPAYQHPYTAAKLISTFATLHRRRVALNLVAGGFTNDLAALGDRTPHDDRYRRLTEYAQIVARLLAGNEPVTMAGRYYRVQDLTLAPALPAEFRPEMLISGSSASGLAAAAEIGAIPVRYPEPAADDGAVLDTAAAVPGMSAVRVGIVARETSDLAWRAARRRFPRDRGGRIAHAMARNASDSVWHERLSEHDEHPAGLGSPYWLGPFRNYRSFCPYLVGDYETVAAEIVRYLRQGCRIFVLDVPADEAEIMHTGVVFGRARALGIGGGTVANEVSG